MYKISKVVSRRISATNAEILNLTTELNRTGDPDVNKSTKLTLITVSLKDTDISREHSSLRTLMTITFVDIVDTNWTDIEKHDYVLNKAIRLWETNQKMESLFIEDGIREKQQSFLNWCKNELFSSYKDLDDVKNRMNVEYEDRLYTVKTESFGHRE